MQDEPKKAGLSPLELLMIIVRPARLPPVLAGDSVRESERRGGSMPPNQQRKERSDRENVSPPRRRGRSPAPTSSSRSSLVGRRRPWGEGRLRRRSFGGWLALAALALSASCCAGRWGASAGQEDAPVACPVGFGGADPEARRLRQDQINDHYCDCPGSGADEPLTGACAGSENWSGSGAPPPPSAPDSEDGRPERFQCPQQPGRLLSPSKVGDGICDCCCGADEPPGECEDVCEQVLAEERARKRRLQDEYRRGSRTREQKLAEYEKKRVEVAGQVEAKRGELASVSDRIREASRKVQRSKVAWYLSRQRRILGRSVQIAERSAPDGSGGMGLFQPLTTRELANWIIHACQLAGEMAPDDRHGKTCLPLRLAGLDIGVVWKHPTYQVSRAPVAAAAAGLGDGDAASGLGLVEQLAEMLHLNANADPGHSMVYTEHGLRKRMQQLADADSSPSASSASRRGRSPPRRRRPPPAIGEDDEDDYDLLGDDDLLDAEDRDEDEGAGHRRGKPRRPHASSHPSSDDDDEDDGGDAEGKKRRALEGQRFAEELRERRPLGAARKSFLEGSKVLLDRMDAILQDMKKREEDEREAQRKRRKRDQDRRRRERKKAEGSDAEDDDEVDADDPIDDGEPDSADALPTDGEGDADSAQSPLTSESLPESFDPTALPLARDKLASLQSQIQRGYQYGVSAKILLDSLLESYGETAATANKEEGKPADPDLEVAARAHRDLSLLAAGTMAHGKISALQAWQIFLGVVSGLEGDLASLESTGGEEGTCQSPWSSACPPRSIERTVSLASGEEVTATIPPDAIRQAAEAFCDEQAALVVSVNAESCASGPQLSAADMPLPASIPDGFLGYTAPKPREPVSNDGLAEALAAWDLLLPESNDAAEADQERSQLEENIKAKRQLGSEQKEIEDEIQNLLDSVGLEDSTKFGPDGELYAFKDECYSYDTGKYVYEICLFGSAKQKEGKGAAGGTNLGEWTGTEVDEETGQRLWRWLNGQRCWNGPSRSATAYITCGANTRVVSVEEPEMCKYELQVESYIACDEAFRTANSLDAE